MKIELELMTAKFKEFMVALNQKVDETQIQRLKEKIAELPTVQQNLDMKQDVTKTLIGFRKDNIDVKNAVTSFN